MRVRVRECAWVSVRVCMPVCAPVCACVGLCVYLCACVFLRACVRELFVPVCLGVCVCISGCLVRNRPRKWIEDNTCPNAGAIFLF